MADTDLLTLVEAASAAGRRADDADPDLALVNTAVGLTLDEWCGPVVIRTVTDERHEGRWGHVWLDRWPISSFDSVVDYHGTTSYTLTEETPGSIPDDGYLLDPYTGDGNYSGRVRRRYGGADGRFGDWVVATYDAGRFADTDAVSERWKRAAGHLLQYLWASPARPLVTADGTRALQYPMFKDLPNVVQMLLRDEGQVV